MNYHDFFFYSIPLGTQVVNLSLLSQAVITRLVVLSGYLPLAGLIPVMHGVYKMWRKRHARGSLIFLRVHSLITWFGQRGEKWSLAFWLIMSHCRGGTQIGYGKQHNFPDSQAKSSCQNNQTQVLNNLLQWNLDLTKAKRLTTLVRYNEVS